MTTQNSQLIEYIAMVTASKQRLHEIRFELEVQISKLDRAIEENIFAVYRDDDAVNAKLERLTQSFWDQVPLISTPEAPVSPDDLELKTKAEFLAVDSLKHAIWDMKEAVDIAADDLRGESNQLKEFGETEVAMAD